jgi:hypothetical protein
LLIRSQEIKFDAPVRLQGLDTTNLVGSLTILRILNTATNEEAGNKWEELAADFGMPVGQAFARHATTANSVQSQDQIARDVESFTSIVLTCTTRKFDRSGLRRTSDVRRRSICHIICFSLFD